MPALRAGIFVCGRSARHIPRGLQLLVKNLRLILNDQRSTTPDNGGRQAGRQAEKDRSDFGLVAFGGVTRS